MAKKKPLTDKQLVEANGGVAEVQAFCGFAVPSAVANWFLDGRKMPRAWRILLENRLAAKK